VSNFVWFSHLILLNVHFSGQLYLQSVRRRTGHVSGAYFTGHWEQGRDNEVQTVELCARLA